MALAELCRLTSAAEAALLAGRLEAVGIHAVCFDAGMNIAESVGLMIPVRIMVLADQAEEARELVLEWTSPGGEAAAP